MAINIDKIADEIVNTLSDYTMDIAEGVKEAAEETAKELLNNIRADAPKRKGRYKKAMAVKTTRDDAYERRKTWYVKAPHYRLAHLLEHGHAKRNGGRVQAFPHIEKNEQKAVEAFNERVERIIKNGGK